MNSKDKKTNVKSWIIGGKLKNWEKRNRFALQENNEAIEKIHSISINFP
jgi:hypothetical protein